DGRARRRAAGSPRRGDDATGVADLRRHVAAGESGARQVAVDSARPLARGPQTAQDEAVRSDQRVLTGDRLVVRIAAVGPYGADRRMIADDVVSLEVIEDDANDLGLARRVA